MPKSAPLLKLLPVYVGVDPGLAGGLVVIDNTGAPAEPMPPTERDVWDWFYSVGHNYSTVPNAVIEKVHSMPRQGVASSFKFGMGYGGLRMALIASHIPFEEVTPQVWQRALGIPPRGKTETPTKWKNRLKAKAQQLYPRLEVTLKTADALLLATYCQRKYTGTL